MTLAKTVHLSGYLYCGSGVVPICCVRQCGPMVQGTNYRTDCPFPVLTPAPRSWVALGGSLRHSGPLSFYPFNE